MKTLTKKQKQELGFVEFVTYCGRQTAERLKRDSKTLSALRVLAAGTDTRPYSYSLNPKLLAVQKQIDRVYKLTIAGQQTLLSDFVARIPRDELQFQDTRRMAKVILNLPTD